MRKYKYELRYEHIVPWSYFFNAKNDFAAVKNAHDIMVKYKHNLKTFGLDHLAVLYDENGNVIVPIDGPLDNLVIGLIRRE